MGARGPIPKPAAERRRRNRYEAATVIGEGAGSAYPIPTLREGTHALAVEWYESLAVSGQSSLYQPSDCASAVIVAEMITRALDGPKFTGQWAAVIWRAMGDLLTTEASRRRAHVAIQRHVAERPSSIVDYREQLGHGGRRIGQP